jgi:hypothetical protein
MFFNNTMSRFATMATNQSPDVVSYQSAAAFYNMAAGNNPSIGYADVMRTQNTLWQNWQTSQQSMGYINQGLSQLPPEQAMMFMPGMEQLQYNLENTTQLLTAGNMITQNFQRLSALDPYASPFGLLSRRAMSLGENLDGQSGFSRQDMLMLPPSPNQPWRMPTFTTNAAPAKPTCPPPACKPVLKNDNCTPTPTPNANPTKPTCPPPACKPVLKNDNCTPTPTPNATPIKPTCLPPRKRCD